MATNTSYITSNSSYEKTERSTLPASQCITWLVVFITECLAIVILNIITIIVFVKQRQLQRRSTFLIIHLAIVDLLVGAVSSPAIIIQGMAYICYAFDYHKVVNLLGNLFPLISLVNLTVISLERLHATFCPFKHRFIKTWLYWVIIAAVWLIATSGEILPIVLSYLNMEIYHFETYMMLASLSVFLFVISASYISICIKVRCSSSPRHHGATNREKKLTTTLLWVTLASLLTWLPFLVFMSLRSLQNSFSNLLSYQSHFYFTLTFLMLLTANSLVNPIIYAVRMPEFRAGVAKIFRRAPNHTRRADLPLQNL